MLHGRKTVILFFFYLFQELQLPLNIVFILSRISATSCIPLTVFFWAICVQQNEDPSGQCPWGTSWWMHGSTIYPTCGFSPKYWEQLKSMGKCFGNFPLGNASDSSPACSSVCLAPWQPAFPIPRISPHPHGPLLSFSCCWAKRLAQHSGMLQAWWGSGPWVLCWTKGRITVNSGFLHYRGLSLATAEVQGLMWWGGMWRLDRERNAWGGKWKQPLVARKEEAQAIKLETGQQS